MTHWLRWAQASSERQWLREGGTGQFVSLSKERGCKLAVRKWLRGKGIAGVPEPRRGERRRELENTQNGSTLVWIGKVISMEWRKLGVGRLRRKGERSGGRRGFRKKQKNRKTQVHNPNLGHPAVQHPFWGDVS